MAEMRSHAPAAALAGVERDGAVRRLKLVYLSYYLGHSGVVAFLSFYLAELGLRGREIGALLAVGPVVGLIVQPLWSFAADQRIGPGRAAAAALAGAALASLLLPFAGSFPALLTLIFAWALFFCGIDPLINALALGVLGERAGAWSRVRLYGSFGNAGSQLAAGALAQAVHAGAMFLWQAAWLLAALPVVCGFGGRDAAREGLSEKSGEAGKSGEGAGLSALRALGGNRALLLFLAAALLSQTSQVMGWSYFPVYASAGGKGAFAAGAGLWIAVVSAFPFFYFGERLLLVFGPRRLLVVSSLAYALRWALLSMTGAGPSAYAIQLLNGFCYGLYHISAVALVHEETPEGLKATGQGLLSAVHLSLATITGGLLGGALLEAWGVVWIYRTAALLALLSLIPLSLLGPVRSAPREPAAD